MMVNIRYMKIGEVIAGIILCGVGIFAIVQTRIIQILSGSIEGSLTVLAYEIQGTYTTSMVFGIIGLICVVIGVILLLHGLIATKNDNKTM